MVYCVDQEKKEKKVGYCENLLALSKKPTDLGGCDIRSNPDLVFSIGNLLFLLFSGAKVFSIKKSIFRSDARKYGSYILPNDHQDIREQISEKKISSEKKLKFSTKSSGFPNSIGSMEQIFSNRFSLPFF